MNENMKTLLTIKRIGINGEGIGFYKHKTVFVGGALPNEEIICEFTKEYKNYIVGQVVRLKTESPHRVKAPCPYFGRCGGCQLQHLEYNEQLKMKKDIVLQSLERYLPSYENLNIDIKETIGLNEPYNYRNKAQLPVAFDGEKVVVGLYEANTNHLVHINKCIIEEDLINEIVDYTKQLFMKHRIMVYNRKFKSGVLRYLTLRYIDNTNECQVTLVLQNKTLQNFSKLAKDLMTKFKQIKSFYVNINEDTTTHEIFGKEFIHIAGNKTIEAKIGDKKFELSPNSFFQLNTRQTKVLYDIVKDYADFKATDKVIDAYCGAGTIGQYIANNVQEVRGVDVTKEAIDDAINNASINNLNNTLYEVGEAEDIIPKWIDEGFRPDVLIMDPPRTGVNDKLLALLRRVKIKKIIYISCNPSTLGKDLNELRKAYNIKTIQPIDMFPQTSHVESVVYLVRK